ncbi:hypothetical protein ACOBQJ_03350 [Pelotomaculum propionicicum]|uniref:hypothetical protein n=1 Tax=Pelotomaculum propionicicum TaxID=258475 RepID=UPI003B81F174
MPKKAVLFVAVLILMSISIMGCAKGNEFVGKWVNDKDKNDVATITSNGDSYYWEDKDGKFPSTYKDGFLAIHTGIGDVYASINNTGKMEHTVMGKKAGTYSKK